MKTNPNDTVFPIINPANNEGHSGLTKREYFAALIVGGMSTRITADGKSDSEIECNVAKDSIAIADALIKELNKPKTDEGDG